MTSATTDRPPTPVELHFAHPGPRALAVLIISAPKTASQSAIYGSCLMEERSGMAQPWHTLGTKRLAYKTAQHTAITEQNRRNTHID